MLEAAKVTAVMSALAVVSGVTAFVLIIRMIPLQISLLRKEEEEGCK